MKKTSFFNSLPFKLLVAVILGIMAGLILNRYSTNGISMAVLNITVTIKYILGQIITFCVPLIVLGFIAPSITRLGKNASLMLGVAVGKVQDDHVILTALDALDALSSHLRVQNVRYTDMSASIRLQVHPKSL